MSISRLDRHDEVVAQTGRASVGFHRGIWRPFMESTLAHFNTKLPLIILRQDFIEMDELARDRLLENGRKGKISVCSPLNTPYSYAIRTEVHAHSWT